MIAVAVIGIIAVLLGLQMKAFKSEYHIYILLGAGIVLFFYLLDRVSLVTEGLNAIQAYVHIEDVYMKTILKMIGIAYIAEFAATICKDAGSQSIAGQIEIFGKLTIMSMSFPIILALLEIVDQLLQIF